MNDVTLLRTNYTPADWSFCIGHNSLLLVLPSWTREFELPLKMVKSLFGSKLKYVVCIGTHAEELHDKVDDLIEEASLKEGEALLSIVTSFHNDEDFDTIGAYCMVSRALENGGILVLCRSSDGEAVKEFFVTLRGLALSEGLQVGELSPEPGTFQRNLPGDTER